MACYLYKRDKSGEVVKEECSPLDVANLLDNGYKSTPDEFVDGDINGDGELSNDEVRQAAKDAGIDKWESARINTLKRELGYDD